MSIQTKGIKAKTVAIVGGGCAGWSLAARVDQLSANSVTLYLKEETHPSHNWGFWQMPWLSDAFSKKRAMWNSWQIITDEGIVTHHSRNHAYCSITSDDWFDWCQQRFHSAATTTEIIRLPVTNTDKNILMTSDHKKRYDFIYDSRPPKADKNILLQHFKGLEIKTSIPVFNSKVAVLMDFRVSQKNGIHFMYVLGYDAYTALVESTFFSTSTHREEVYDEAIKDYLSRIYNVTSFKIIKSEKGIIPMGDVRPKDQNPFLYSIGSNAGAIRPSSGYAFSFIQKQITRFLDRQTKPTTPHKKHDLMMDHIFLEVLKSHPEKAQRLFFKLARALDGDSFARFLSGEANIKDYFLVINSMPKWLFINQAVRVIIEKWKRIAKWA